MHDPANGLLRIPLPRAPVKSVGPWRVDKRVGKG
jgi:hypothetical protein